MLIRCFLHGFLKIRNRARKLSIFGELSKLVWDAYHQTTYEAFIDKITVLSLWSETNRTVLGEKTFEGVKKLCDRAYEYAKAYNHHFLPYCPRAGPSEKFISPVHRLNGKVYHQNWLENLLVLPL